MEDEIDISRGDLLVHADNVPDAGPTPPQGYSFNNPACSGTACTPNVARVQCDATHAPPNCTPLDQPVQATRVNATPQDLQALNTAVQQTFAQKTQGQSVFQYYKLVNVLWSKTPNAPNDPGPGPNVKTPLSYGPFVSDQSVVVANTTMETYVQADNCNDCHQYAAIAGKSGLASDFSFLHSACLEAGSAIDIFPLWEPGLPAMQPPRSVWMTDVLASRASPLPQGIGGA